jgi:hypothetical protein
MGGISLQVPAEHWVPDPQVPQDFPHPSSPHSLPEQFPVHGVDPQHLSMSGQQSPRPLHALSHQHPAPWSPQASLQVFSGSAPHPTGAGAHLPDLQVFPDAQVPQDLPHPSSPHSLPEHDPVHVMQHASKSGQQLPNRAHSMSHEHPPTPVPLHLPLHVLVGSFPQSPVTVTHLPDWQVAPFVHVPHCLPQPSSPHSFPEHWDLQSHTPSSSVWPSQSLSILSHESSAGSYLAECAL